MNKYDALRLGLNFFELIAFLTGLIYFKKVKKSYWKWFVVYLGIIVLAELTAEYLHMEKKLPNQWIYTWFVIPFEYLFFFWLFYMYFRKTIYSNWPLISGILYMISYTIDMAYLSHVKFSFSSLSYMTGSVFLLLLTIFYFFRLLKSDNVLYFKKDIMFWIATGILVLFLGSFPFFGLWNTLRFDYPSVFDSYWILMMIFNCTMYLFFSFSFIWANPK